MTARTRANLKAEEKGTYVQRVCARLRAQFSEHLRALSEHLEADDVDEVRRSVDLILTQQPQQVEQAFAGVRPAQDPMAASKEAADDL